MIKNTNKTILHCLLWISMHCIIKISNCSSRIQELQITMQSSELWIIINSKWYLVYIPQLVANENRVAYVCCQTPVKMNQIISKTCIIKINETLRYFSSSRIILLQYYNRESYKICTPVKNQNLYTEIWWKTIEQYSSSTLVPG